MQGFDFTLVHLFSFFFLPLIIYYDDTKHKIGKIPEEKTFFNVQAGAWAFGMFVLWILFFPLYLYKRSELIEKAKANPREASYRNIKLALLAALALGGGFAIYQIYIDRVAR